MKNEPHVIRLRSAWQCESLTSNKIQRVLCRRHFGCPTGLDAHTQVMLVVERPMARSRVALNGLTLGYTNDQADLTRFDITDQLRPRNEIQIEMECETPDNRDDSKVDVTGDYQHHQLIGQVRLEIRSPVAPQREPNRQPTDHFNSDQ